ncbi:hypothetical protein CYY_001213 [Polysphondylium violaceum]|uniref:(d)CMP kinase n=1 Tax=Polysphondylium violaceum TaxID=133409 RepID=A0A8J4Q3N1_9MYCE|nr:hypothetical protein CYY_001213 [Polysphondylium violaceum]
MISCTRFVKSSFDKLSNAYIKNYGDSATSKLKSIVDNTNQSAKKLPVILIAGQQLTGKSTMANRLSKHFQGGKFYSVGTMFREIAAQLNISVGLQSKMLREIQESNDKELVESNLKKMNGRRVDIDIDYNTCEIIAGKSDINDNNVQYIVIEGRQPAIMGSFLEQEPYNRKDLIKIFVTCSAREKAIRFLQREIGTEQASIAEKMLPDHFSHNESLSNLTNAISKLPLPDINKVMNDFTVNQNRDEDDRQRYIDIYGIDYQDEKYYDFIIDTSNNTAPVNFQKVLDQLDNIKFQDQYNLSPKTNKDKE